MPAKGQTNNPKGRPKGIKDIRTQTRRDANAIADRLGCDPFEILVHFAKGDADALGYDGGTIPPDMRLQAAKEASQYLYPKRKAVEHSGEIKGGLLGEILQEINGSADAQE